MDARVPQRIHRGHITAMTTTDAARNGCVAARVKRVPYQVAIPKTRDGGTASEAAPMTHNAEQRAAGSSLYFCTFMSIGGSTHLVDDTSAFAAFWKGLLRHSGAASVDLRDSSLL
ncbi:hypothetical protein CUR178_03653 [Leishmania enriettii]|uniref:Uncharacterized protein n=1 Tax=Leishmania enriettii TaxID=5663 RepID=A0A836H6G2_LEIEN|nr:hypothetical protein CUR178_03653 [Leishmania enriettii]